MNLTLRDSGYRKPECEIETETCSDVLQLSSGPLEDAAECSENSKNSKDSQAMRMFYRRRMVMSNRTIDRKCTLRKKGKERQFLTSFDLGDHNKLIFQFDFIEM